MGCNKILKENKTGKPYFGKPGKPETGKLKNRKMHFLTFSHHLCVFRPKK